MPNSNNQSKPIPNEKKASKLWNALEPYKDKYLQVWWYGGMEKGKRPGDQPQVHILFREVLEDLTPTNNFIQVTTNITDIISWKVDSVWHQQRKISYMINDTHEFIINHSDSTLKFLRTYKNVSKTKQITFFKNREEYVIEEQKRRNCLSFNISHPQFDQLLIPCLEFLARAYGLSTELVRVLTTYDENERTARLFTPYKEEKGLWTVLLGDGITRDDYVFVAYYKYTELAKNAARILFSSIAENSNLKHTNIYPKVTPWHTETLPIIVSGFHLPETKTFVATRIIGMKAPKYQHIRITPRITERTNTPADTNQPNPPLPQLGNGDIKVSENQGGRRPSSDHEILDDNFVWIDGAPDKEPSKYKYIKQTRRPNRKKKFTETQTIGTGSPDGSSGVLNNQIVPLTNDHNEFKAPEDGRIIGLWKACIKAMKINPSIIKGISYYTFEQGFTFSEIPMLIGFFTESENQSHKSWCYENSFKNQRRGALIIRLTTSKTEPIYIFDIQPATYTSVIKDKTLIKERGHSGLIFQMKQEKNIEQFISDLMYLLPLHEGSYPQDLFQTKLTNQLSLFRHSHTKGLTEGESTLLNALKKLSIKDIKLK